MYGNTLKFIFLINSKREQEELKPNFKSENFSFYKFQHDINENLVIAEKKDLYFSAWMLEFILPNSASDVLSPREVYVTLSEKELYIFEDIQQRLLEFFKLTNLNWICDKEYPCLPSEMLEFYR